jgi:Transposase
LKRGGFLAHRSVSRSEDETEIRAGEGANGKGRKRHPAGDPPAILGRREDPHRAKGLRGEESIAELCRREGIVQNLYYRWSKDFLEAGRSGSPATRRAQRPQTR